MAISLVQTGNASGTTTAVIVKTLTAGNLLVVACTSTDANAKAVPTDGVNTYVQIGLVAGVKIDVNGNSGNLSLWYVQNVSGGATTITATELTSGSVRAVMLEYSGIATSGALDQTAQDRSVDTGTQILTGATSTRTQANEVLVCAGACPGDTATFTAGTSFTKEDASATQLAVEDWIVSTTGTDQGTWASFTAVRWGGIIATFKAVASAISVPGNTKQFMNLLGAGT